MPIGSGSPQDRIRAHPLHPRFRHILTAKREHHSATVYRTPKNPRVPWIGAYMYEVSNVYP